MALITAADLAVGYGTQAVADGLDFAVNSGDYLCIVGENGAGKSTLMKTILRLQEPVSGRLVFDESLDRGEIGYLPQQTLVQKDFPASVREVVLSGCQAGKGLRPFYSKEDKQRAEKNIERMGVEKLAERCYRELSGGQQQRVLLARALCAADRLLVLDEPAAGLDPAVTQDMYELIAGLNRDGMTIVMISHDISAAVRYATHILMVGNLPFYGTREEFLTSRQGKAFVTGGAEDDR